MTLYQFNSLEELWERGVMIGHRIDDLHKVVLYQIHSFYVELFYHSEYNVLRRLRSFSNVECLDAYIQDFKLPDIG